jgi:hypothetical protein
LTSSEINEQLAKLSASYDDVVGTEGEPDLFIATFSVKKLTPEKHKGAFHEDDFQTGGTVSCRRSPGFLTSG